MYSVVYDQNLHVVHQEEILNYRVFVISRKMFEHLLLSYYVFIVRNIKYYLN